MLILENFSLGLLAKTTQQNKTKTQLIIKESDKVELPITRNYHWQ